MTHAGSPTARFPHVLHESAFVCVSGHTCFMPALLPLGSVIHETLNSSKDPSLGDGGSLAHSGANPLDKCGLISFPRDPQSQSSTDSHEVQASMQEDPDTLLWHPRTRIGDLQGFCGATDGLSLDTMGRLCPQVCTTGCQLLFCVRASAKSRASIRQPSFRAASLSQVDTVSCSPRHPAQGDSPNLQET